MRHRHLDEAQRAHARRAGEGEGEKPELRGDGPHDASAHRAPPMRGYGDEQRPVAQNEPADDQHALNKQAERQGDGRGHYERRRRQGEHAAAVTRRRQAETSAGPEADERRPPTRRLRVAAALRPGHQQHAGRRDADRRRHHRCRRFAQEGDAEQRDQNRLGLGVGDRHEEGAVAHRPQHQRRRGHLRRRAGESPAKSAPPRPRKRFARRRAQNQREQDREGEAE